MQPLKFYVFSSWQEVTVAAKILIITAPYMCLSIVAGKKSPTIDPYPPYSRFILLGRLETMPRPAFPLPLSTGRGCRFLHWYQLFMIILLKTVEQNRPGTDFPDLLRSLSY